jgi:hypothetical protein
MNTFCFCIYGTKAKYTQGLVENLRAIQTNFPMFQTLIHYGSDVPDEYIQQYRSFPNVTLIPITATIPMMARIYVGRQEQLISCEMPIVV